MVKLKHQFSQLKKFTTCVYPIAHNRTGKVPRTVPPFISISKRLYQGDIKVLYRLNCVSVSLKQILRASKMFMPFVSLILSINFNFNFNFNFHLIS